MAGYRDLLRVCQHEIPTFVPDSAVHPSKPAARPFGAVPCHHRRFSHEPNHRQSEPTAGKRAGAWLFTLITDIHPAVFSPCSLVMTHCMGLFLAQAHSLDLPLLGA